MGALNAHTKSFLVVGVQETRVGHRTSTRVLEQDGKEEGRA